MKVKHFVFQLVNTTQRSFPEQSGHRQRVSQVSWVGVSRGMASGAGQAPSVLDLFPINFLENLHVISWRTCAAWTSEECDLPSRL